tara:strand:+ start:616 stop:987 length:372 start_codon:yes stop_codon:yes gene_type:complete
MKNKIFILLMLVSFYASAQKEFQGLWAPTDDVWFTTIQYNELNKDLSLLTFSYISEEYIEENIIKHNKNSIYTSIENINSNWKVLVKYVLVNDTLIEAKYSGSTDATEYLYKINLPKLPLNVE